MDLAPDLEFERKMLESDLVVSWKWGSCAAKREFAFEIRLGHASEFQTRNVNPVVSICISQNHFVPSHESGTWNAHTPASGSSNFDELASAAMKCVYVLKSHNNKRAYIKFTWIFNPLRKWS